MDVVVVDVLVVVDDVDVDVVEVDDRNVEEVVVDEVAVVVVPQPLQVLAQCVTSATRLSHKPCLAKAMH